MERAFSLGICTLFVTLAAAPAAASPFAIHDLDATERWEIKALAEYERSDDARLAVGPAFDVAYGVVPRKLELSVEFGHGALHVDGMERVDGLIDTELAAKWTIRRPDDAGRGFFLTTEPELMIPTGASGLSEDVWRLEIPLMVGKQFGAVQLAGLIGYSYPFGAGEEEIPFAVLALADVAEDLRIGCELAGDAPADEMGDYELTLDVGFKWEFREGVELQGLIARTVRSKEDYVTSGKLVLEFEF